MRLLSTFTSVMERAQHSFPTRRSSDLAPPENIHLQEERRLFYVALTRAQERLYVSSVSRADKKRSIFIEDLLSDPDRKSTRLNSRHRTISYAVFRSKQKKTNMVTRALV